VVYSTAFAVGGGLLRTGCGPGPLEPALDNSSEGNTASEAAPILGAAFCLFLNDRSEPRSRDTSMKITINGHVVDVPDGLSVDGLLSHLNVKPVYTAVALNREVTPKSAYASMRIKEGDRIEIVRPMGGG
jgi:sulfur carrier protein